MCIRDRCLPSVAFRECRWKGRKCRRWTVFRAVESKSIKYIGDAPVSYTHLGVSEEIKLKEIDVAIEKTKAEQVQKAVEAALKKAGINPAHVDLSLIHI